MPTTKRDFLGVHERDRVQVFIDATNLMGMLRTMDVKMDYKRFIEFLREETRLVRASYYVMMKDDMPEASIRVIDMIEYSGFDVNRKWVREFQDTAGHYRQRGTIIPEMTVGMIDAAEAGIDHIIMVSADGEMLAALEGVKNRGIRITVMGLEETMSEDLRRGCDAFVDISSLKDADVFFGPDERRTPER